ncbi:MAG TPA: HAD family hydrolase [Pirellulales bacterium]|nr:HAD family hydrolase [Pirellulales bacterium]
MKRFALLDRDGTINVERHYLSDPDQIELTPNAAEGLAELRRMGLGLVVLTNQSGVARGMFDEARLEQIHERLRELLRQCDVELDAIVSCTHHPDEGCACRKPLPGLVEAAAREHGFEPAASFVIGDKPCDIDLGAAVGATTLLVRTGYGARHATNAAVQPNYVVDDLLHAARVIAELV